MNGVRSRSLSNSRNSGDRSGDKLDVRFGALKLNDYDSASMSIVEVMVCDLRLLLLTAMGIWG
jgi:hypothetical protein